MKRRKGWDMRVFVCRRCGGEFSVPKWRVGQKYCSRSCLYVAQIVPPMERLNFIIDERGCHVWQGGLCDGGYAMMTIMNVARRVHVVTYEKKHGPVPEGMEVDHLCRNRACINVDHLEAVTHAVNCRRGARWPRDESGRLLFGARVQPQNFQGRA